MEIQERNHRDSSSMIPGGDIFEEVESTIDPLGAREVDAEFELSVMRSGEAVIAHQGAFPGEAAAPAVIPLRQPRR